MQSIEDLHTNAMDIAEEAFVAQRKGNEKVADELFQKALSLELQAAETLPLNKESEPTRSILYRSAASISYNLKDYELTERLIAQGLSGFPPQQISEELKNLYEDVNFHRHLRSKGLILDKNQLLMSIAGDAVRYGGTAADYLMMRVDRVSTLFYRTVERLLKIPYRTAGGVEKMIKDVFGLYINSFAPASFAVSFQVGTPDPQLQLPGFEGASTIEPGAVVDEIMDCFEIFEGDETNILKKRIKDEDYFDNFIGLAKQIAPDGKNINLVGFTSVREGKDRPVALRKSRKNIQKELQETKNLQDSNRISFSGSGLLMHANTPLKGRYGTVKLVRKDNNDKIDIKVPVAIMKDVVQPYYEENVTIQGYEEDGKTFLEEIDFESND